MTPAQDKPTTVLALTRKAQAASFEQRVAGYASLLADAGIELTIQSWPRGWRAQRRMAMFSSAYDLVWWQRYLPAPWIAPMIRRHTRKLVFDFDDPVIYSSRKGGRRSLTRKLRFAAMLRHCDVALAASEHLAQIARPYCRDVRIVPMPIDMPQGLPFDRPAKSKTELVWIGSSSTQPYLELIRPALSRLGEQRDDVRLRLVAHQPMEFGALEVDFRQWSPTQQDAALEQCHIGLCPMPDTLWTKGKCPYKVLQYMAWALPWVGSAVGENLITAEQGRGRCAFNNDQWFAQLVELINDPALRCDMGKRGHAYVQEHHDRSHIGKSLAAIWHELAATSRPEVR